ncbi:MAG: Zn-ribbon domain-containing OB-fold protein [Acidimicrobiales bacterium]
MSRPQPVATPTSQPFWDATRQQRYLLQWCRTCDRPVHFPRSACPRCLGSDMEWRPAGGKGRVYTFTVDHRPSDPAFNPVGREHQAGSKEHEVESKEAQPYVIALVDLDEGVRVMTNVVGCDPEMIQVGMRVELAWEPLEDGRYLPLFTPAEEERR